MTAACAPSRHQAQTFRFSDICTLEVEVTNPRVSADVQGRGDCTKLTRPCPRIQAADLLVFHSMNSPQLALRITLAALCAPPTYQFRSAGRQHVRMAARHAYRGTGGRFFALPVPCAGVRPGPSSASCVELLL